MRKIKPNNNDKELAARVKVAENGSGVLAREIRNAQTLLLRSGEVECGHEFEYNPGVKYDRAYEFKSGTVSIHEHLRVDKKALSHLTVRDGRRTLFSVLLEDGELAVVYKRRASGTSSGRLSMLLLKRN